MIRPLHPDDAPALYQLLGEPSSLTCDYFDPGADRTSYRAYTELAAGDHHRLVITDGKRLLGLGILEHPGKLRVAHLGQIRLMAPTPVLESGAGDQILAALVDLADNWLNLKRLEVDAPASMPALAALLRRHGFESEGVMRKAIGPGPAFEDEIAFSRLKGLGDPNGIMRLPALASRPEQRPQVVASSLIRPMAPDDIEDLYEIFRAPENCRTTMQLPSQEIWLTRQRVLAPPASMIHMVAEYDGRVIGTISLKPRNQACRAHTGQIGMMIHPEFWGLGIGSRLMEEVLDVADQQLALVRVELQVHTDNVAGIRLYQKSGFTIEGTKRFHTFGAGGWSDTYFMARIDDALTKSATKQQNNKNPRM